MKITYYEAKGETKTKLMEMLTARRKAVSDLDKWASQFGARIATHDSLWGFNCVLAFPEKSKVQQPTKDLEHFKRTKHGHWTPRLSTKRGKELAKEKAALTEKVKGVSAVGRFLGIDFIEGSLHIPSVGCYPRNGRLAIVIRSDKYKPKKGIQLTRISDVRFEKLTGEKL